MITALSPLDGRYANKLDDLAVHFSEHALLKERLYVEIVYFIALSDEQGIRDLPKLNKKQRDALLKIYEGFTPAEAKKVKQIEKTTNHDVKAVEYYLKKHVEKIPGLKKHVEFIHFSMTSEDVNNLAYARMVHAGLKTAVLPELKKTIGALRSLSKRWKNVTLLSLTHGQSATPTTVGKELAVFADRLEKQYNQMKTFKMDGKFGGAVGNYSAHATAYPAVKWERFGTKFLRSLGVNPLENTTQINPHDDIAELSHIAQRANTICIDWSRDAWQYISRGVFKQKIIAGEVGSSTMPHKVNPIDFENAEGNFGLSNALFQHFAQKLPISRLQRDLSDSTVQRNIGSAFGYQLLALRSLQKGMSKIALDAKVTKQELLSHAEVLAEPVQIILRKKGVPGAYEQLKTLTRGANVSKEDFVAFMDEVGFSAEEKKRVLQIIA